MAALASSFGALGLAFGCLGRPSETLGAILGRSSGVFWLLCAATATNEAMLYALGTISGPSDTPVGSILVRFFINLGYISFDLESNVGTLFLDVGC